MSNPTLLDWLSNSPDVELHLDPIGDSDTTPPHPRAKSTKIEKDMWKLIMKAGLPLPLTEHTFHPARNWRFDFAWPDVKIMVACQGGIWQQTKSGRSSGHCHPVQYVKDRYKFNTAQLNGWICLEFAPEMFDNAIAMIQEAFASRSGELPY